MAEVKYNEAYYEVEASRWIASAGAKLEFVSTRRNKTGEHVLLLHCRFADGTLHTCDVWPREYLTKADAERLAEARIVDVWLRFGRKPVLDENGEPVLITDPKTGKQTWKYSDEYGYPKWVAYITDDGESVSVNGGAIPFDRDGSDSEESNESANAE